MDASSPSPDAQLHSAHGGSRLIRHIREMPLLDKLTAGALFVMSPLLVFGMWTIGGRIDRVALACGASALLAAAVIVLMGRRWAPLLAAVPGALTFGIAGRFIFQALFSPSETINFGFWVVLMAVMGVATVASITGTAEHYLHWGHERFPHWVNSLLAAIGALSIGAIIVAALPEPSTAGIQVQPEALARLPALGSEDFKFTAGELRVKAGETIAVRLENADDGPHSFDVDELGVHVPMPSHQNMLALFSATKPGQYTFYCAVGTHAEAGMVGTLVVEP